MNIEKTCFDDVYVLNPTIFKDYRGYFTEIFNSKVMNDLGLSYNFVQDNESYSSYGTLRGIHIQKEPWAQAKLVRVTKGRVLDVVVDLRVDSSTFGEYFSVELSDENHKQLLIPRGFGHGFVCFK